MSHDVAPEAGYPGEHDLSDFRILHSVRKTYRPERAALHSYENQEVIERVFPRVQDRRPERLHYHTLEPFKATFHMNTVPAALVT